MTGEARGKPTEVTQLINSSSSTIGPPATSVGITGLISLPTTPIEDMVAILKAPWAGNIGETTGAFVG